MSCINCGSHNVREGQKSVTKIMMLCNDCGHNYQIKNPSFKHAMVGGAVAGAAGATIATTAAGQETAEVVGETAQAAVQGATEASSSMLGEILGWFF